MEKLGIPDAAQALISTSAWPEARLRLRVRIGSILFLCCPGSRDGILKHKNKGLPQGAAPPSNDERERKVLCRELILKGKEGGEDALELLFQLFAPMLENRSRVYGVRDEELSAEQSLAFLKCLLHFTVEELAYAEEFIKWERKKDDKKPGSGGI